MAGHPDHYDDLSDVTERSGASEPAPDPGPDSDQTRSRTSSASASNDAADDMADDTPEDAADADTASDAADETTTPGSGTPTTAALPPVYGRGRRSAPGTVYGALDLGTNNCRLLLATPSRRGFRVVDSFSRIIRLGEGVSHSGLLSPYAMQRTIDALKVCASKVRRHRVERARFVATEACRVAGNGSEFLERVRRETGLRLEMLSRQDEARLAVAGCASLIDTNADLVLVFDIGGGSTEVVWLDLTRRARPWLQPFESEQDAADAMMAWTSLPVGVVTLAETFGSDNVTPAVFEAMVDHVGALLAGFEAEHQVRGRMRGRKVHLLGTSGTVTTVAGILLGLPRYDRTRVDGAWIKVQDAQAITYSLLDRSHEARVAEPCVGKERADLVLAGCAILEALLRQWPSEYLRVADRGLREGILTTLMSADGVYRPARRRRPGGRQT